MRALGVFHSLSHARIQFTRSLSERDKYYINRLFPSSCFARSPPPESTLPGQLTRRLHSRVPRVRRLSPRFRRTSRKRRRPALRKDPERVAGPPRLGGQLCLRNSFEKVLPRRQKRERPTCWSSKRSVDCSRKKQARPEDSRI